MNSAVGAQLCPPQNEGYSTGGP